MNAFERAQQLFSQLTQGAGNIASRLGAGVNQMVQPQVISPIPNPMMNRQQPYNFTNPITQIGNSGIGKFITGMQQSTPAYQQGGINSFNIKNVVGSNRSITDYIPQFQAPNNANLLQKVPSYVANMPVQIGSSIVGKGVIDPVSDIGKFIGGALSGKGTSYNSLKSPLARLESNFAGEKNTPQQFLGNAAGVAEAPFNAYAPSGAKTIIKDAMGQVIKDGIFQTAKQSAWQGAKLMGGYGFLNGLAEGRNDTLVNQLVNAGKQGGTGAVIGLVTGGALGAGSATFGKIFDATANAVRKTNPQLPEKEVIKQSAVYLKAKLGQFAGSKSLKQPFVASGMTKSTGEMKINDFHSLIDKELGLDNFNPQSGKINFGAKIENPMGTKPNVANAGLYDTGKKVYHAGTHNEFKIPTQTNGLGQAKAVYFSETAEGTKYYQRGARTVQEATIKPEAKIWDYRNPEDVKILNDYVDKTVTSNPAWNQSFKNLIKSGDWGTIEKPEVQAQLKKLGFDGFVNRDMTGHDAIGITNLKMVEKSNVAPESGIIKATDGGISRRNVGDLNTGQGAIPHKEINRSGSRPTMQGVNPSSVINPRVAQPTTPKAGLYDTGKETVTLYRAAPKFPNEGEAFKKGTYFADDAQKARYYSESHYKGNPQDIKVEQFTVPKSAVFKEPSTGNYILKSEAPATRVAQPTIGGVSSVPQIPPQKGVLPQIEPVLPMGSQPKVKVSPSSPTSIAQDTRQILTGTPVKERGFTTSVKESAKTPQQVKDLVSGTYIVKSNEQLKKDALTLIKADPATAEQLAINPQNDTHVQIGNELINYYGSKGDFAKASQIADGMAKSGTDFGRAVQAFSQYDKTTPQGAIRFAQSKVNEYNRIHPQAKLKVTDTQVQSLFDKAHSIQAMPEGRDRNIAANELMNEVNNMIPSSIADKLVTIWKAGLLTSLRTHERNLIGNTLHNVAETAKDIPANIADRAMALRTGQRSTTFTLKGVGSGTKTGLQSAKDIVTKGYDPTNAISKYDVQHITWGNNPVEQAMKHYTDTVFRTLGAADKPFYNASFARSMYDQAGAAALNAGKGGDKVFIENLVKNPTPEMLKAAVKDAEVATFHNQTGLSKVAQAIQGFKPGGIPVGQVAAPFTGVPSAVAGQMVSYSPIGLIKGIATAGKVLVKNVPELQRQAAQEIGRGVIGSGLIGLGAYLASKGLISGQPKDPQEAAQWQLEGKQANSILIGGKWRGIGSIGPENLVMLAGAKAQEELGPNGTGDVGKLAGNIGKDFLGQTFLQGVQQPLAAINDPARYGASYLGNQGSSVIPNIVKDTSKAFDPNVRENNKLQDYFTNSIPGLRNQNITKRDALGNVIPQEPTGAGAFVDLFNSKTPISNPVVDELSRLNNAGNNATPGKIGASQTINGQKMKLTPEQINTLESQVGPQATQALGQLFQNPDYQNLSDEDKAKAVDSVMTSVRKQVRGNINLGAGPIGTNGLITPPSASSVNGQYTLVNPQTGTVKQIDLSKPITEPTMTGGSSLDKVAISKYNSELTARANDIYALYQANKITAQQADAQIAQLKNQALTMDKYGNVSKGPAVPKGRKPRKPKNPRLIKGRTFKMSAKAYKPKKMITAKIKTPKVKYKLFNSSIRYQPRSLHA